ncbi:MAG: formyltetrahydrofolate deformylase [Gemmatimonadetes bacterium]|nr:formyltetrahydrofolate deformylase [Gemmatimonadota bacterium]|tara:strand:+ start:3011 stop:3847 length:837 start_codon:yes stop_codon:yes gene_type:complete
MTRYILRVECPDATGLIFKITKVIFDHGLNILSNGEFVYAKRSRFFLRAELEGQCDTEVISEQLRDTLPEAASVTIGVSRTKDVVLLVTRESHCLGDLLLRHSAGEFSGHIHAVVSNRPDLGDLVERFDVPFHCIPHEGVDRDEHESRVLETLDPYPVDYLVLAKYMRILSADFVGQFLGRMVNIHHSFLPAFVGENPYGQAFQRGVKIIGATAHFVTDDLDEGPIIAQNVIPVDHTHSAADMAQAGRDVEKSVLARALKLVLEERVFISGNRTIIFD